MKLFITAASKREGSYNKKLIQIVSSILQSQKCSVDLAE